MAYMKCSGGGAKVVNGTFCQSTSGATTNYHTVTLGWEPTFVLVTRPKAETSYASLYYAPTCIDASGNKYSTYASSTAYFGYTKLPYTTSSGGHRISNILSTGFEFSESKTSTAVYYYVAAKL